MTAPEKDAARRRYSRRPKGPGVYEVVRKRDGVVVGHAVQRSEYHADWRTWSHWWVGVMESGPRIPEVRRNDLEGAVTDVAVADVEAQAVDGLTAR